MESKWNETFGIVIFWENIILEGWSRRQGSFEEAMRQGAHPPPSWMARDSSSPTILLRGLLLVHKNHQKLARQLDSVWYYFFCRTQKQGKNRNWHWALG